MKTKKINCEKMRGSNALRYFKSLKLSIQGMICSIASCKYARTPEIIEYFLSKNPSVEDICNLIEIGKLFTSHNYTYALMAPMKGFQLEPMKAEYSPEKLEYSESLEPLADDSKCIDHKKEIESKTEKH